MSSKETMIDYNRIDDMSDGPNKTVLATALLIREMMEHEHPLAKAVGAHFEARSV